MRTERVIFAAWSSGQIEITSGRLINVWVEGTSHPSKLLVASHDGIDRIFMTSTAKHKTTDEWLLNSAQPNEAVR